MTTTLKTTGYEYYSQAQRDAMVSQMERDIREESRNADGSGLRAEIARAAVRTLASQIRQILETT